MTATTGRFIWRDLMTTDLDGALKFYTGLFPDWQIDVLDMGSFQYNMILVDGCKQGGFVPLEAGMGIPTHWILYIDVPDCDTSIAQGTELGGTCCIPAFDADGVGRFAVMQDPQKALYKPFQLAHEIDVPNPTALGHFCWHELMTSDGPGAVKYYSELFGWETHATDMGEAGLYTLFRIDGKDVAGAMQLPADVEAPPHWMPYILVDDVDTATSRASELGATIHAPPRSIEHVGRFSVLGDPQGGAFAVFQNPPC